MKNGKKLCLLLLCVVLMTLLCAFAAAESADSGFEITGGVLTKYTGPGGDVVIPDGVTEIGSNAFENCKALTSIVIPDSVTKIGEGAFSGCTGLKEVTVPDGVTSIEDYVFYHCEALERVSLPKGIVSIGHSSFEYCLKLTDIQLPSGLKSIDNSAFWACRSLVKLTLPQSLETIGYTSFGKCSAMNPLQVPETLKSIGAIGPEAPRFCCETGTDAAYVISKASTYNYFCEDGLMLRYTFDSKGEPDGGLVLNDYVGAKKEVLIPSDVTSINNEDIFKDRTDLVAIRFQGNTRVSTSYFTGCTAVIQCPAGYSNAVYLLQQQASSQLNIATYTGSTLMCYAGSLTKLKLQNDWIYGIAADAFNGSSSDADSLETIILPAYLQNLLDGTFSDLDNLKEIYFGDQLSQIGEKCFGERTAGELPKLYCTAGTKTARTLSNAGYTFLTPHVHTIVIQPAVEATYTETGKTEGSYCSGCGEVFTAQEDVPALGEKDFTFTTDDTGATVTGYTGENADVQLPSALGGKPVVAIDANAFNGNETITSVTMPDSVTRLERNTFSDCSDLQSVILPKALESLPWGIFSGCQKLTDVSLPVGLKTMEGYAFKDCGSLREITLPEGLQSIEMGAFWDCRSLTSVTLPASLESMETGAFGGCTSLTDIQDLSGKFLKNIDGIVYSADQTRIVTVLASVSGNVEFAEGIMEIPMGLFDGNTRITGVVIPEGVTRLDWCSFRNCVNLETVQLPESLTRIEEEVFEGCQNLTGITLPAGLEYIGMEAFAECRRLSSITLPAGLQYNEPMAFRNCNGLTELQDLSGRFYQTVDGIVYSADGSEAVLALATVPEDVQIMEGVTSISAYALAGQEKIVSVLLPDSVLEINSTAISENVLIRSSDAAYAHTWAQENGRQWEHAHTIVTLPAVEATYTEPGKTEGSYCSECGEVFAQQEDVPALGEKDFTFTQNSIGATVTGYTGESTEVKIPSVLGGKPVIAVGSRAFANNETLTSVVIPEGVTSIGNYAFYKCTALVDIEISEGVTSIGNFAFGYCKNLTGIVIPEGVTSIQDYTFYHCASLASIVLPEGMTSIGNSAFDHCIALTSIVIPEGVSSIKYCAFGWCENLISVTLPSTLKSLGESVFRNCGNLTSIEDKSGQFLKTVDGIVYSADGTRIIAALATANGEIRIAEGVTKIPDNLFYGNDQITSAVIPKGVTKIDDYAFYGCTALTSIEIPDGVTYIGIATFRGCTALMGMEIPESVTSIRNYAFGFCKSLTGIAIPESVTAIENSAFSGCTALTSVTLPSTLRNIGDDAFPASVIIRSSADAYARTWAQENGRQWEHDVHTIAALPAVEATYTEPGKTEGSYCPECGKVLAEQEDVPALGEKDFTFTTDDTGATVTGYKGESTEVHIPSVLGGKPVTKIAKKAFYFDLRITGMHIPASVAEIEEFSFYQCRALDTITVNAESPYYTVEGNVLYTKDMTTLVRAGNVLEDGDLHVPSTVTYIAAGAFSDNKTLQELWIPASVQFINGTNSCGSFCRNFRRFHIDEGNTQYASPDGALYNRTVTQLFLVPEAIGTYRVPDSVTSIADCAIGGTYYGSTTTLDVTMPEGLAFTGDCMFQWMQGTVTFLNPKIRFGEKCFMSSQNSVIIRGYAGSTAQTYAKTNGIQFEDIEAGLAFQYTTDETGTTITGYTGQGGTVEIPSILGGKPVVAIGDNAFNGNETITSVTMPDSVTTIGQRAFYDCKALKQLTLPENLTDIGAYAFSGCTALQNVTLPGKLATIAERAFDYTALTAIHIPASVTMIGQRALSQNYDLLKITVDETNNVYCAEDNVLYNKEKTKLIQAGSGLSGDWSIPFGVKTVEAMAFWNCWTLETLRIPATVQSIGQIDMLGGCCEKLSAIVVDAANPVYASLDGALCSKDGTVLYYLPENIGTYTVPDSVTRIANGAIQFTTSRQEGLNLTLPESLSMIEDGNFSFIHGVFTFLNPNLNIGSDWFMDCNAEKVVIRGYAGSTAQALAEEKNFAFEDLTISAQFQYTVDDTGATVTGYTGQGGTVEIPSILGGKPVVAIGNNAFQMPNLEIRTDITAVILPEGLQSIGRAAFWGCAGIASIEIPDSVTEIGWAAFETCTALAQVTLPKNLTQISDSLFHNCPLTEIDLPQGITRIGDYAFRDTGLTAIVIPEGTLSVGKCAFEGCSELSAVTIPASVTEVGECAFANCPKLAPLDEILPEKLTKVIDGVVYNADGTQIIGILPTLSGEVRIADGITVIPQWLFADNTSITSVILPNSIKTIEWRAFSGCTSLAQIEFPEGLLTIGDYAFSSTGLTTVVLPSTLTTFGEGVFDGCTKLANIEDKSGKFLKVVDGIVYNVDGTQILSVLESCTGEVRILEGVTEIPAWLFNGNSQITSIVIPEGVTKIGNNAFSYCENLTSVTLPSTLTTLGEDVFNGCIKLANIEDKSGKFLKVVDGIVYNVDGTQILSVLESCTGEVRIAEGVTEISEDLFRGRTGITSIYLPDSVTAIDAWAFAYCENLKTVELPAGLERLEDYTFWFCESLEQINLPSSLKSIGGCAFLGNALKEIELPEGLNVIGRRAFERNPLTFIRIPASVTQIEEGAFAGCSALKNLQNDSSVVLLQENGVLYNEDGTVLIGRMADMPAEVVLKEGLLSIPANFFMAENITSIVIPDSVTSVGYSVFWGCRQLTEVRLSECLTVLESGMFDECTQLGELYVPSAVTSIDPTAIPDTTVIRSEPDAYARTWAQENGYVWQCAQHGEAVIAEPAVPATRKHTGMTAKIQCSVCGAVISEPEEVPVFDGKVMKLPAALKSVQRETFLNLPAECFVLPDGCLVIGEKAFADCKMLKLVEIPASVVAIADDAFEGCENVLIVTPEGSAAERYAQNHGILVTSDDP